MQPGTKHRGVGPEAGVAGSGLYITDPTMAPAALGLGGAAAALLASPGGWKGWPLMGRVRPGAGGMSPPGTAFAWMVSAGAGLAIYWLLPRAWTAPPRHRSRRICRSAPCLVCGGYTAWKPSPSLSSLAETVNQVYEGLPRRCESFPLGH